MTLSEDDLAAEISSAQRQTFRAFRNLYDAVKLEAALMGKRREQARLARVEVPPRVLLIPPSVLEPADLFGLFRVIFQRHPAGIVSEGVRLRGVARDEHIFEAVE